MEVTIVNVIWFNMVQWNFLNFIKYLSRDRLPLHGFLGTLWLQWPPLSLPSGKELEL